MIQQAVRVAALCTLTLLLAFADLICYNHCRIYVPELLVAFYLLLCASYDVVLGAGHYYLYIFLQAFAFLVLGFGFIGTATPCSCP